MKTEAESIYDYTVETIKRIYDNNKGKFTRNVVYRLAKTAIDELRERWDIGEIPKEEYENFSRKIILEVSRTVNENGVNFLFNDVSDEEAEI